MDHHTQLVMVEDELVDLMAVLQAESSEEVEVLLAVAEAHSGSCHSAYHEVDQSLHSSMAIGPWQGREP